MHMRRSYLLRVFVYSALLIVSLAGFLALVKPINSYALSDGDYMSSSEALSFFGSEIPCHYNTSSGIREAVFRYNGVTEFDMPGDDFYLPGESTSTYNDYLSNCQLISYTATLTGLVNDPTQIVVDIIPRYSIFDTTQIYSVIGLSGDTYSPGNPYNSASWDWRYDGIDRHFESPVNAFNYGSRATLTSGEWVNFVPASMTSFSNASGYSLRAVFPLSSEQCTLVIGVPYTSVGAYGSADSSTTTTSNDGSSAVVSGINQTNDILTNNNTLLGGILDVVVNLGDFIVDGVSGLFVPEEGILESFENDLAELLQDTFGGIDNDMLVNVIKDLLTHGATESVTFPAIDVPLTNFHIPSYSVPLKPNSAGLHSFYESIALAIDLVSTCAVLNLVMQNIKTFLVGEKVVDIQNAD